MLALIKFMFMLLAGFVRLGITPIKTGATTLTDPVGGIPGQTGAMPDFGNLTRIISSIAQNGAPAFGNFLLTRIGAATSAATWTGSQMVGGIIRREASASFTDCTDTATNIVAAIPGAVPLQTFLMLVCNAAAGTCTVGAGTGVTLVGSTTVSQGSIRLLQGQVTGSAAVTLTNIFQIAGTGVMGISL